LHFLTAGSNVNKKCAQFVGCAGDGARWRIDPKNAEKGEEVMAGAKSFLAQELINFFEAAWFDLPAEAGKVLLGSGDEEGLRKAGWKTYDAWVNLANGLTNTIYSDPFLAEATGRVMEAALRFRQISGWMTTAFFGNFWPFIGLPTHNEMVALREDLLSLREELAAYAAGLAIERLPETETGDAGRATLKSFHSNGYRPVHRNADWISNGKRNVAAQ
jgi:hypothetical protein